MELKIVNFEEHEPEHLAACIERVRRWVGEDEDKDAYSHPECMIFCNKRDEATGWIEYGLKLTYRGSGHIYVAGIQRKPGGPVEFHS